jgi:uncharacterized iron-regulated protein
MAFSATASAQKNLEPYQIFDKKGKKVTYQDLFQAAEKQDIVLFGELHNDPIAHWLQLCLTQDLYEKKGKDLLLGAEMFETDNQLLLDEYLQGSIAEKSFEAEARLWNNYQTDYKPLINFAKDKNLKVIASNVPRRYAALVAKEGVISLEKLSKEAKNLLPPLPFPIDYDLPSYANMRQMMGTHAGEKADFFIAAQALKDASMAHQILNHYEKNKLILHFNGAYHSDKREGIVWYLERYQKEKSKKSLDILTISTVLQKDLATLSEEAIGVADFIIVVDERLTRTY